MRRMIAHDDDKQQEDKDVDADEDKSDEEPKPHESNPTTQPSLLSDLIHRADEDGNKENEATMTSADHTTTANQTTTI
ncbi:hypothetical protein ACA910_006826 [Epithemia clementina (nom. ined.)]